VEVIDAVAFGRERHVGHQVELAGAEALEAGGPHAVDVGERPALLGGDPFEDVDEEPTPLTVRAEEQLGWVLVEADDDLAAGSRRVCVVTLQHGPGTDGDRADDDGGDTHLDREPPRHLYVAFRADPEPVTRRVAAASWDRWVFSGPGAVRSER